MLVCLKRDRDGFLRDFGMSHATALLRMQVSGQPGWVLNDKKLKFNGHDIIKRTSRKRSRKSDKED